MSNQQSEMCVLVVPGIEQWCVRTIYPPFHFRSRVNETGREKLQTKCRVPVFTWVPVKMALCGGKVPVRAPIFGGYPFLAGTHRQGPMPTHSSLWFFSMLRPSIFSCLTSLTNTGYFSYTNMLLIVVKRDLLYTSLWFKEFVMNIGRY